MTTDRLDVTFLDVGWGDSVLIQVRDKQNQRSFALVDSNDTANYPSSVIFLKRYFERLKYQPIPYPMFEHVFVTHAHTDHVNGIQSVLRTFGSKNLYSSRCDETLNKNMVFANLIRWANKPSRKKKVIQAHSYLARNDSVTLGPVLIDVLWPPFTAKGGWDPNNENNNSLVLALTLGNVRFVLTGDCVARNWDVSRTDHVDLPQQGVRMVQHPHHGARNGLFFNGTQTPLLDQIATHYTKKQLAVLMGMSCHLRPHHHPHPDVIAELDRTQIDLYRTDQHYHTTFRTGGTRVLVRYSRF